MKTRIAHIDAKTTLRKCPSHFCSTLLNPYESYKLNHGTCWLECGFGSYFLGSSDFNILLFTAGCHTHHSLQTSQIPAGDVCKRHEKDPRCCTFETCCRKKMPALHRKSNQIGVDPIPPPRAPAWQLCRALTTYVPVFQAQLFCLSRFTRIMRVFFSFCVLLKTTSLSCLVV